RGKRGHAANADHRAWFDLLKQTPCPEKAHAEPREGRRDGDWIAAGERCRWDAMNRTGRKLDAVFLSANVGGKLDVITASAKLLGKRCWKKKTPPTVPLAARRTSGPYRCVAL